MLELDPKDVITLGNLGLAYANLGDLDSAIESYLGGVQEASYADFLRVNDDYMEKIKALEAQKEASKLIDNGNEKQHIVKDIDELMNKILEIRKNSDDTLFFRGQNDFRWELKSAHQREGSTLKELEKKLTQFKISIQAHLNIDDNLDDGNYYALMQHYGIHTPFLDFSEFLNTALYFAISDSNLNTTNNIPCIWVLITQDDKKESLEENKLGDFYRNKVLSPNLKDKRIRAQNGVFVWSDDENSLNENTNFELHQIIIFDDSKSNILELNQKIRDNLELSSTNATKIYPDDKGLAYEINFQAKGITSHKVRDITSINMISR